MDQGRYSYSVNKPYTPPPITKHQKFAEDISCIIKSSIPSSGSLFISNIEAAENINTLKKLGIGAILTCAKGYQLHHSSTVVPYYKYIPTVDHEGCDLSPYFDDAADFIKETLAKTNTLVHCIAGVSRSVSMVIAYFIREKRMSYDDAYLSVKLKRKIISPNDGFIKQLKSYQQKKRSSVLPQKDRSPRATSTSIKNQVGLDRYSQIKTPSKFSSNLDNNLHYHKYKSIQQIPQQMKKKFEGTSLQKYQSYDITPKKPRNKEELNYPSTLKDEKFNLYKTSNSFYTPSKEQTYANYKQGLQTKNEYSYSKHTSFNKMRTVSEQYINIDKSLNKQEENQTYEVNKNKEKNDSASGDRRKGQNFQLLKKDLNEKIELIRKKYDGERQKLYQKYSTTTKKHQPEKKYEQHPNIDTQNRQFFDYTYELKKKRNSIFEKDLLREYEEKKYQSKQADKTLKEHFSYRRESYPNRFESAYPNKYDLPINSTSSSLKDEFYHRYEYNNEKPIEMTTNRLRSYTRYDGYSNSSNYLSEYPSLYNYRR